MNIKDFIAKYNNHPVLFIGTGISLRYIDNSYSWDDILKKAIFDVAGDEEEYFNIKSRHQINGYYQYPAIATEVELFFNKRLENDRNGKFKTINDRFFENMKKEIISVDLKSIYQTFLRILNLKLTKLKNYLLLRK